MRLLTAVTGLLLVALCAGGRSATAADPSATEPAQTAPVAAADLLADLQDYLAQRQVDVDALTVERVLALMVDWYRESPPAAGGAAADLLLFRYGGWSEGCATGFNVSLLRRAGERGTAGITLMFEPSSGAAVDAFTTALADRQSTAAFVGAVRGAPAFAQFGNARPMAVALDGGRLRHVP